MNEQTITSAQTSSKSATTMQAAVVSSPKTIRLAETSIPDPGENQVRFRVEGCGLCASNIPPFEGRDWFEYPMPPASLGHEAWGIVDALGEKVTRWQVGDRVAAISYNAYADYDLASADNLVRIPAELENQPFPGEPLACTMNIFRRADIQAGMTVAVVGCGFLGCLLIQLARQADARVIAISRRQTSLDYAKEMGADACILMDDHHSIIEKVKDYTEGKFCDRVIEATGKQWPLDLSGELTAERGKLIIAGFHQDGLRKVNMQLWNWRGIDVINAHEREEAKYVSGLKEAVEAVKLQKLRPEILYTHTFPKEDIQQAFEMQLQKPEGFMKAIIRFDT